MILPRLISEKYAECEAECTARFIETPSTASGVEGRAGLRCKIEAKRQKAPQKGEPAHQTGRVRIPHDCRLLLPENRNTRSTGVLSWSDTWSLTWSVPRLSLLSGCITDKVSTFPLIQKPLCRASPGRAVYLH